MSTKFLVDRVLPGNLPPVSVCRSFFGTKFAELATMFCRPDCWGLAVIHHYLTVKQCAIQSTNQAFALLSSPVSCPMETMADLNPLSPHHRPMMNDHLWSMVCCKAWLHCSHLPTQLSRILQTRDYSTLHSFFLIVDRTLQKLNTKRSALIRNLHIYQNWFGRDLAFEFLSQNMSLIVLKLCFLQADFEQIYQKHVSRPSWQAFLASGHQIFRANFETRWTNRQQPRVEAKI